MFRIYIFRYLFFASLLFISSQAALYAEALPRVEMQTSMGTMEIELFEDKAPITVKNFLRYVKEGFYDGLIFHRVVFGWIIQGGGYNKDLLEYDTYDPIKSEADNGLRNARGTIAMARTWQPDSADSQFFINLKDNPSFDHRGESKRTFGYCVFGKVVKGMDVADAIGAVEKHQVGNFAAVPVEPIIIEKVTLLTEKNKREK